MTTATTAVFSQQVLGGMRLASHRMAGHTAYRDDDRMISGVWLVQVVAMRSASISAPAVTSAATGCMCCGMRPTHDVGALEKRRARDRPPGCASFLQG
jgi:hypothetical protein